MSRKLHNRLPWSELAAENTALAGEVDASELAPRLAEALAREQPAGIVRYELHFVPGEPGRIRVTGHLSGELEATCQRCLQPFRLPLEVDVAVSVADSPSATGRLRGPAEERDAAELEEADVAGLGSLADLIEEELLLAIPFLPRHEMSQCPAAGEQPEEAVRKDASRRPFAGLREALERSREDEPD